MNQRKDLEELRTHAFYFRTFISLLILFTVFAIYYLNSAINTFLFLLGSATILIFIHLSQPILGTKILYRILCLYLMIFIVVSLNLEPNYILSFMIVLLLPITFSTLLGKKEGLVWSIVLLFPIIFIFTNKFNANLYASNEILLINILIFLSTYFLILYIDYREETTYEVVLSLLEKQNADLREVQNELKVLKQILPFCSNCKKIRDEKGVYLNPDEYISKHMDTYNTHSICPDCKKALYPDSTEK